MVKNLPTKAGNDRDGVQSLDQEGSLEEEMATHSSVPAWKIPWTEEPGGLQSMGSRRVDMTERPSEHAQGVPTLLPAKYSCVSCSREVGWMNK